MGNASTTNAFAFESDLSPTDFPYFPKTTSPTTPVRPASKLSPGVKAAIMIGIGAFVAGLVVLILWLTGVLFKGDNMMVVIPSTSDLSPPKVVCPTNGMFSKLSQVDGDEADFGTPIGVTTDGTFFITSTALDMSSAGDSVVYQRSGDTYALLDTSNFVLPSMTRIGFALISDQANHVVSGITNVNFLTAETEFFRVTRKIGSTFFNTPQDLNAVSDGYPLIGRPLMPSKVVDDSELLLGFRTALSDAIVKAYRFSNDTWSIHQTLEPPVEGQQNFFGVGMSYQANILVLTQISPPMLHVYARTSPSDQWIYQAHQSVSQAGASPLWGVDCALSDNGLIAVVSDPFSTVDTVAEVGEVYLYKRSTVDEPFEITQKVRPQAVYASEFFGIGVFLFGNTLYVSCSDNLLTTRHGEVYTIDNDTGLATFAQRIDGPHTLTTPDTAVSATFGAFFTKGEELFMLLGSNNAAGSKGAVEVFKTACEVT